MAEKVYPLRKVDALVHEDEAGEGFDREEVSSVEQVNRLAWGQFRDSEEELSPLPESLRLTDRDILRAYLWAGLWGVVMFIFIVGSAFWYLSRI